MAFNKKDIRVSFYGKNNPANVNDLSKNRRTDVIVVPLKGDKLWERAFGLERISLQDLIGGNDLASIELPTKLNSPGLSGQE